MAKLKGNDQIVVEEGVVVAYKGKFWGKSKAGFDGIVPGWVDIKHAYVENPLTCLEVSDMATDIAHKEEVSKGKLIKIQRFTTFITWID